eukprot:TRINITY_DN8611_c0_g2_i3.p1 TRINITY_DN8611_c0_g2~~TRINITY_DN8611_c0_g2_i3.p1  ORF type:complete len:102 (-),score=5.95 TRINITY_DN8611_c0_g2_i3:525-830(-)
MKDDPLGRKNEQDPLRSSKETSKHFLHLTTHSEIDQTRGSTTSLTSYQKNRKKRKPTSLTNLQLFCKTLCFFPTKASKGSHTELLSIKSYRERTYIQNTIE